MVSWGGWRRMSDLGRVEEGEVEERLGELGKSKEG